MNETQLLTLMLVIKKIKKEVKKQNGSFLLIADDIKELDKRIKQIPLEETRKELETKLNTLEDSLKAILNSNSKELDNKLIEHTTNKESSLNEFKTSLKGIEEKLSSFVTKEEFKEFNKQIDDKLKTIPKNVEVSIGKVETLDPGEEAKVEVKKTDDSYVLNFYIPRGVSGRGMPGKGVPSGGTTNQVLAKNSNDDYDTKWVSGGSGGTAVHSELTNLDYASAGHTGFQPAGDYALSSEIPTKTSELTNDSNFVVDASYVHTDNNFTTTFKNKLTGIADGAEVNVNADWNATSGDAQILNKPTIPVNTDEKVKYDTNDPTAGYVADKIIAGTGISVAEGTGANENKLVITNDNPTPYTLPIATTSVVGGVKPDGATITVAVDGTISAATGGGGDVTGPAGATADDIVLFDGATGKIIKDSSKKLSDLVASNVAITGATKTKITYDTKGLVTSGADATTADIADSTNKRYVSDAQLVVIGNTSGTNTGDNAVNSLYSGLVTNATHTGEVTGSGALTVDRTAITNKNAVTAVGTDYILISDTDDTGNLKKALLSDVISTVTQYTDEMAQDAVGGMVNSTLTYTDGTPELKVTNPVTPAETGFTITAGTTPKTLTVPLDASVSGTNTGDQVASNFDIKDLTDSTSLRTTWSGKQDALGFTPENSANKKTDLSDNSDTYYPSQKAVKTAVDGKISKTTNITSLNETGIADGEIAVFNLTNKDIRTSDKTIVTTLGADDTTVPTSKAVKDVTDGLVTKALYDAQTILQATSDNTPVALTVGEQTFVGRKTGGNIAALSASEARTILNVADGATADSKCTGAEIDTGTDDTKFATAKAITDSKLIFETDIVDNLTSTSTTDALSANQGKNIKDNYIQQSYSAGGSAVKCGYQVDSKDLYVKRFYFSALGNAGVVSTAHGLTNFLCVKIEGTVKTAAGTQFPVNFSHPTSAASMVTIYLDTTNINVLSGSDRSGNTAYIDIYYISTV